MYTRARRGNLWNTAFAVIALAVVAGPAAAQSQKVYDLKLQSVDQPSNIGPAEILPAYTKLVEQMSGGRLKISVFTAGQIVPTGEIVNALVD